MTHCCVDCVARHWPWRTSLAPLHAPVPVRVYECVCVCGRARGVLRLNHGCPPNYCVLLGCERRPKRDRKRESVQRTDRNNRGHRQSDGEVGRSIRQWQLESYVVAWVRVEAWIWRGWTLPQSRSNQSPRLPHGRFSPTLTSHIDTRPLETAIPA